MPDNYKRLSTIEDGDNWGFRQRLEYLMSGDAVKDNLPWLYDLLHKDKEKEPYQFSGGAVSRLRGAGKALYSAVREHPNETATALGYGLPVSLAAVGLLDTYVVDPGTTLPLVLLYKLGVPIAFVLGPRLSRMIVEKITGQETRVNTRISDGAAVFTGASAIPGLCAYAVGSGVQKAGADVFNTRLTGPANVIRAGGDCLSSMFGLAATAAYAAIKRRPLTSDVGERRRVSFGSPVIGLYRFLGRKFVGVTDDIMPDYLKYVSGDSISAYGGPILDALDIIPGGDSATAFFDLIYLNRVTNYARSVSPDYQSTKDTITSAVTEGIPTIMEWLSGLSLFTFPPLACLLQLVSLVPNLYPTDSIAYARACAEMAKHGNERRNDEPQYTTTTTWEI